MIKKVNGISQDIINQIVKVIIGYKRPEKLVIFGSRAKDTCKENSDIDIAIFGKDWTDRDVNIIKNILNEVIKTPLKIDIVNFYYLRKEQLKRNILKEEKILYES